MHPERLTARCLLVDLTDDPFFSQGMSSSPSSSSCMAITLASRSCRVRKSCSRMKFHTGIVGFMAATSHLVILVEAASELCTPTCNIQQLAVSHFQCSIYYGPYNFHTLDIENKGPEHWSFTFCSNHLWCEQVQPLGQRHQPICHPLETRPRKFALAVSSLPAIGFIVTCNLQQINTQRQAL